MDEAVVGVDAITRRLRRDPRPGDEDRTRTEIILEEAAASRGPGIYATLLVLLAVFRSSSSAEPAARSFLR